MMPKSRLVATFAVESLRASTSKPDFGIVRWLGQMSDDGGGVFVSALFTTMHRRRA